MLYVISPKYIWFRKQLQWEVRRCRVQCGLEGEEKAALGKWHLILGTETSETEVRLRWVERT